MNEEWRSRRMECGGQKSPQHLNEYQGTVYVIIEQGCRPSPVTSWPKGKLHIYSPYIFSSHIVI